MKETKTKNRKTKKKETEFQRIPNAQIAMQIQHFKVGLTGLTGFFISIKDRKMHNTFIKICFHQKRNMEEKCHKIITIISTIYLMLKIFERKL